MPKKIWVTAAGVKEKMELWVKERGGVLVWPNENLSDPDGGEIFTPAITDGEPTRKPHWSRGAPTLVTDINVFQFATKTVEVKRFRVAIRRSAFAFKLTDASTRKLREAVSKAGKDAFYAFDYGTQEAVIHRTVWEEENGVEKAESYP